MAASSDSKWLLEIHKITQSVQTGLGGIQWLTDRHPDTLPHGDLSWASTAIYSAIVPFSILQLGVVTLRQCMNYSFPNFTEHP